MALSSTVRFRPFTHEFNTLALLPHTTLACAVTPSHVRLYDYASITPTLVGTISYAPIRPLEEFTVTLDLEKGQLLVSSRKSRLILQAGLSISAKNLDFTLEGIVQGPKQSFVVERERLTLGVDKAQEWPQVVRRGQMAEILPFWYYLSQSIPLPLNSMPAVEGPSLLAHARLKELFLAGFKGLLVPTLEDTRELGFDPVVSNPRQSPLYLLHATRPLIRSLFFQEDESGCHILPNMPSEFLSGTLSPLKTCRGHTLMLEWTKGEIRRLQITAAVDDEIIFHLQKPIKRFRLRESKDDRRSHVLASGSPLKLRQHQSLLLDSFSH